jgi:predicted MFS family arabinose efflux permease
MLGPAVVLGMARFAYALVLPAMRTQLGWSFTIAGAMNTANGVGYLIGAPLAAWAARRVGERRSFLWTMALTALVVLGSAATGNLAVLLALRFLAGTSGAVCFVVGAGLVAQAGRDAPRARATLLLSVYFAGGGIGMVLAGLAVPPSVTAGGWRAAWLVMGALSLLGLAGAIPAARAVPETTRTTNPADQRRPPLSSLAPPLVCYGLFGAGYIAYMTFIVAALTTAGAGPGEITAFWSVLAATAVAAAFVWGRVLAAFRPGTGLTVVLLILTTGAVLPVIATNAVAILASAPLFGATFLTVVTAVTSAARRSLPHSQWTAAIAVLTIAFALGQCVGPVLSGAVSEGPAGIRLGLAVGTALLLLAAMVAPPHDRMLRHLALPAKSPSLDVEKL